jgi:hypothetical protein
LKVFFVMLLWRTLGSLDQLLLAHPTTATATATTVSPPVLLQLPRVFLMGSLLCADLFALVLSFLKPLNFKSQLKGVLGLHILKEGAEGAGNALQVLAGAMAWEEALFRGLANFWWMSLCYTYTRSRWTLTLVDDDHQ